MGKGIDMATGLDLETGGTGLHGTVLDDFKDQLLISMCKELRRLGHDLQFPVAQLDDTGQDLLSFHVENDKFHFELSRKS